MRSHRTVDRSTDKAFDRYQARRIAHWDSVAASHGRRDLSNYYHRRLEALYRYFVQPGQRILELGSGNGDLLAALEPSRGVGIDFSAKMVKTARERHPDLEFIQADAHESSPPEGAFDAIILSDLVNDVWDVQAVLERVRNASGPQTRVVLNHYNKLWQGPLQLARLLGLAKPLQLQNWLSKQDLRNLLHLAGFEIVSESDEILMPVNAWFVSSLFNRILVKVWPFRSLALAHFFVARRKPDLGEREAMPSVSVVVPARNEAGNIAQIIERTPPMGSRMELIFVEGNSSDDTYDVIQKLIAEYSGELELSLHRQPGTGKGDAVRQGFEHATGDILMILDADMTVAPEELPRFYQAIADGTAEFVNGVRLVYPMESEAMRFLNYLGNKFFGAVFSWLLGQPVKDTLCGTKVLTREAYDTIAVHRDYFGDFDPFGDFDLLFGAAKNNLKIVDMPIRYRDRTYGSTNIDRWRHGVLLLKMAAFASRRMKFV